MKAHVGHKINLVGEIDLLNNDIGKDDKITIKFSYDTDDSMVRVSLLNIVNNNIEVGHIITNDSNLLTVVRNYRINIGSAINDIIDNESTSIELKGIDTIRSIQIKSIKSKDIYKISVLVSYNNIHTKDVSACYTATKWDLLDIKSQLNDIEEKAIIFMNFNDDNNIEELPELESDVKKATSVLLILLSIISVFIGLIAAGIMFKYMGIQKAAISYSLVVLMNILFKYIFNIKKLN